MKEQLIHRLSKLGILDRMKDLQTTLQKLKVSLQSIRKTNPQDPTDPN